MFLPLPPSPRFTHTLWVTSLIPFFKKTFTFSCVVVFSGELFTFLGRQCTPVVPQNRAAIVASCLAFLRSMIDKSGIGKEIRIIDDGKPIESSGGAAGASVGAASGTSMTSDVGDKSKERSPKRKGIPDVASRPASGQFGNRRVSFLAGRDADETGESREAACAPCRTCA